jgi:hypothetical protein
MMLMMLRDGVKGPKPYELLAAATVQTAKTTSGRRKMSKMSWMSSHVRPGCPPLGTHAHLDCGGHHHWRI